MLRRCSFMSAESTMPQPAQPSNSAEGVYLSALEDRLADQLSQASQEVDRAECFDDEQRAEVYAILEALHSDTRAHRRAIHLLSPGAGGADA